MKKGIIMVSAVLCLTVALGCESKQTKINEAMEEYARNYYLTYIKDKVENLDVPQITIKNLKAANKVGAGYDMERLKGCTESSNATIYLNEDGTINKVELSMNCK